MRIEIRIVYSEGRSPNKCPDTQSDERHQNYLRITNHVDMKIRKYIDTIITNNAVAYIRGPYNF